MSNVNQNGFSPKFARKFNNRVYLLMQEVFDKIEDAYKRKRDIEDVGLGKIKVHPEANKFFLYKMK